MQAVARRVSKLSHCVPFMLYLLFIGATCDHWYADLVDFGEENPTLSNT